MGVKEIEFDNWAELINETNKVISKFIQTTGQTQTSQSILGQILIVQKAQLSALCGIGEILTKETGVE